MIYFILCFLLISADSFASNDFNSFSSISDLLYSVRDPVFNSRQRVEILELSRKKMVQKLVKDTGVTSSNALNLAFVKNPLHTTLLYSEPWFDVQTEFYSTVHKENFHRRWLDLQKLVYFTEYGKGLYQTMMGHWGNYSPTKEGRYYARWSKISVKTGNNSRQFNIPFFLMSENINDLLKMEHHEPYKDLIPSNEINQFYQRTNTYTGLQRQELAEKSVLNHKIYLRTIANGAKTIGSIYYLTGVKNITQTTSKITTFIDKFCIDCSANEKNEYKMAAIRYIEGQKKNLTPYTPETLVKNFCRELIKNNYHWNVDRLKPTPFEILLDQTALINYYIIHKLKEKNREAIAKTILAQDLGVLFLTNSINLLDKNQEPLGTKLNCDPKNIKQDSIYVVGAIEEAQLNVEAYISRVNKKIVSSKFNLQGTNSTLEYFVQTNQAATIEAASSFPQGIGWILKSIAELDQDVSLRKKTDAIVSWGGAIVGIGLTITGIGAPEGVAVLITSIGVVKGIGTGTYFFVRSEAEKEFAKEIRFVKQGSGIVNEDNLKYHFDNYKKLKITYIKDFGASAVSFITIHRFALQASGGDIAKSHNILTKAIDVVKTQRDKSFEKIQSLILQLAKN